MTNETTKKKRGRGRPKSAEVAKDKVQVWFRASPAEKRAWIREARKLGNLPLRTWIRITLNKATKEAA